MPVDTAETHMQFPPALCAPAPEGVDRLSERHEGTPKAAAKKCAEGDCAIPDLVVLKIDCFSVQSGMYKRVPGGMVNGYPVWCNTGWRLFTGKKGHWLLSRSEEEMLKNVGYVRSKCAHGGDAPHLVEEWEVHTGGSGWSAVNLKGGLFEVLSSPSEAASVPKMHIAADPQADEPQPSTSNPNGEAQSYFGGSSDFNLNDDQEMLGLMMSNICLKPKSLAESPYIEEVFTLDDGETTIGDDTACADDVHPFSQLVSPALSNFSEFSALSCNSTCSERLENPRTLLHFLKNSPKPPQMGVTGQGSGVSVASGASSGGLTLSDCNSKTSGRAYAANIIDESPAPKLHRRRAISAAEGMPPVVVSRPERVLSSSLSSPKTRIAGEKRSKKRAVVVPPEEMRSMEIQTDNIEAGCSLSTCAFM